MCGSMHSCSALDRFVDALSAKDKLFYKAKLTNGIKVADAMLEVFVRSCGEEHQRKHSLSEMLVPS